MENLVEGVLILVTRATPMTDLMALLTGMANAYPDNEAERMVLADYYEERGAETEADACRNQPCPEITSSGSDCISRSEDGYNNGDGCCNGDGYGYGDGEGYGDGDRNGYGHAYGKGDGDNYGDGNGDGNGGAKFLK